MMSQRRPRVALAGLPVLLLAVCLLSACQRVAPVRTLPAWVHAIYVPMIENDSYEPALTEEATRLTQEAFLLDGRLDVAAKDGADLYVVARILDWRTRTAGTTGEDVADRHDYQVLAEVQLFEPYVNEPLADLGSLSVGRTFNTDVRSIDYVPEPDRKRQVLNDLAGQIVMETITGFPTQLRNAPLPLAEKPLQQPESRIDREVLLPGRTGSP